MRHARSPSTGYTGLKVVVPRGAHMGPMATDPSVDNETATDQHHAAAGPTGQRNHSTDLLGCGALLPWDPSCKRWTTTELLRRASAEVVAMRNVDREWMVGHMLEYRDHYRQWTGHRNAYIAAADGWREHDFNSKVASAESFGIHLGWSDDKGVLSSNGTVLCGYGLGDYWYSGWP